MTFPRSWFSLLLLSTAVPGFTMSVQLQADAPSNSPVGTKVVWTAEVADSDGPISYQFRVRTGDSGAFRVVRDFSPNPRFEWVQSDTEGQYQLEVTARNEATGESAVTGDGYSVTSRVSGGTPVISPTQHPLVYLYSAPPCAPGGQMRVLFQRSDGPLQSTPSKNCVEGKSLNFYVAGLRGDTAYSVKQVVNSADKSEEGPALNIRTQPISITAPVTKVIKTSTDSGIILQSNVFQTNVATDMEGQTVWYVLADIRYLTRPEPGGKFVALFENQDGDDSQQILRVIDLAGVTLLETNAAVVNQALEQRGMRHMTSFHHEARILPDGKILVLAGVEQIMTDVQGDGDVDVLGDMILVLDQNLQLVWAWDAFDHLNPYRKAILDEKCQVGTSGCPVLRQSNTANDWLHGNALQRTPDGHILYSARHQDWVIKIDYADGAGSGGIIWKLGKDGDFQLDAEDPLPWFSHQHDPNFEFDIPNRMLVFDNGNTRWDQDHSIHSRGQVLEIDEWNRTAKLVVNFDLCDYSRALGSAQKLPNGNYHFDLGWDSNSFGQALEYTPSGELVSQVETEAPQYRSFRMADIYTP